MESGQLYTLAQIRSEAQAYNPNGSTTHEVRWLPTNVDETFTAANQVNLGAGSMFLAINACDATNTSTTTNNLNGSVEISIVWEWIPDKTAGSLSVAPRAPLPYTSQQVLSTITDLGSYLFHGLRTARTAMGMAAGVASQVQLLSGGVGQSGVRGPQMPMIRY